MGATALASRNENRADKNKVDSSVMQPRTGAPVEPNQNFTMTPRHFNMTKAERNQIASLRLLPSQVGFRRSTRHEPFAPCPDSNFRCSLRIDHHTAMATTGMAAAAVLSGLNGQPIVCAPLAIKLTSPTM